MNLDDLMAVWRSQDAAPLHGVNETLLRLALRQDEAKLQRARRGWRWFIYVLTAVVVVGMARRPLHHDLSATTMCYPAGTTPSRSSAQPPPCCWVRLMYVRQRAQVVREQRFGDSLRDQINRQLAQLDDVVTMSRLARLLGMLLLPICLVVHSHPRQLADATTDRSAIPGCRSRSSS